MGPSIRSRDPGQHVDEVPPLLADNPGEAPMAALADPRCRCASGRKFKRCCGPLLAGAPAPDPQALMRSRYSAFALGEVGHLVATVLPGSPAWSADPAWREQLAETCARTRFTGLRIVAAPPPVGDEGRVHFVADFVAEEGRGRLEERSRFRKVDGRWFYVDGDRAPEDR